LKRERHRSSFAVGRLLTTTEEVLMSDTRAAFDSWLEAFNAHDEAAIRAATADDCVFEGPGGVRLEGGDASTAYAMGWLNAFSDATLTAHTVVVDGDWVAMTGTFKGTHDGTLSGPDGDVPPTRRTLEGRCAQLVRFRDGKSVEEHLYYDQMDVVTQLGLMSEVAGATA
jgi:predicted ester cyclase